MRLIAERSSIGRSNAELVVNKKNVARPLVERWWDTYKLTSALTGTFAWIFVFCMLVGKVEFSFKWHSEGNRIQGEEYAQYSPRLFKR